MKEFNFEDGIKYCEFLVMDRCREAAHCRKMARAQGRIFLAGFLIGLVGLALGFQWVALCTVTCCVVAALTFRGRWRQRSRLADQQVEDVIELREEMKAWWREEMGY